MDMGLIFGMIVAIFVMGLLIVFGYQQITNMLRIQQQAEMMKAVEGLKNAVDRVYSLGGETSEPYRLAFPAGVGKVCFMPAYRGAQVSVKEGRLRTDLLRVIEASGQDKYQLTDILLAMRFSREPGSYKKVDKNQTLLVIFQETIIPDWLAIPHLEPSKKTTSMGPEVICVTSRTQVWLQRKFDETGAWVDVEVS